MLSTSPIIIPKLINRKTFTLPGTLLCLPNHPPNWCQVMTTFKLSKIIGVLTVIVHGYGKKVISIRMYGRIRCNVLRQKIQIYFHYYFFWILTMKNNVAKKFFHHWLLRKLPFCHYHGHLTRIKWGPLLCLNSCTSCGYYNR